MLWLEDLRQEDVNTPLWTFTYFYLTKDDKEYCLEPLLDWTYYLAVYDLKQNLLWDKKVVSEKDMIKELLLKINWYQKKG